MNEKKYTLGGDELVSMLNIDKLLSFNRYAGGHDEHMGNLIKGAEIVGHWNEGDWQGAVATCIKLDDGRYAIYNDYYGSCSGCDAWEDANDDDIRKMCEDLAKGAYLFESLKDVIEFLSCDSLDDKPEWFDWNWSDTASNLLEAIKTREGDSDDE